MLNFPSEIREKFLEFFSSEWRAAFLIADDKGELVQWGGNTDFFGITKPSTGQKLEDRVVALFGLLDPETIATGEQLFLEHISVGKRIYADVLILSERSQYIVFFKDSSEKALHVFDVQQSRNNLKLLVEALEHSVQTQQKMRSNFLEGFSGISHEIKNSMIAMQSTFDEMQTETSATKMKKWISVGQGAMKHLQSLVYQTMDFSKLEAGKQRLFESPIMLTEFFAKLHSALAPLAASKELDLRFETHFDDVDMVLVDGLKLYQVFTNLIGNAIKFTDKGFVSIKVTAKSDESGGRCKFGAEIADSGVGIAAEDQKSIFEQFSQVGGQASKSARGVGLGLTITTKLLDILGSSLSLQSTLGVGSTFSFKLDLEKAGEKSAGIEPSAEIIPLPTHMSRVAANPLNILMADDDPANCLLFQKTFENEGHRVTVVTSGKIALELVDKKAYDLIVLDRRMPEMDGIETCTELRQRKVLANERPVPIVIYTADEQLEYREEAKKAGANRLITKGCGKKELFQVLDEVLQQSKSGKHQKG